MPERPIGTGCKPVGLRLRRFESCFAHYPDPRNVPWRGDTFSGESAGPRTTGPGFFGRGCLLGLMTVSPGYGTRARECRGLRFVTKQLTEAAGHFRGSRGREALQDFAADVFDQLDGRQRLGEAGQEQRAVVFELPGHALAGGDNGGVRRLAQRGGDLGEAERGHLPGEVDEHRPGEDDQAVPGRAGDLSGGDIEVAADGVANVVEADRPPGPELGLAGDEFLDEPAVDHPRRAGGLGEAGQGVEVGESALEFADRAAGEGSDAFVEARLEHEAASLGQTVDQRQTRRLIRSLDLHDQALHAAAD